MSDQRERLKQLFISRPNTWIPLYPDIMTMFISAYNRCIKELRAEGMTIINRIEKTNGSKHSYYKYVKPEVPKEDFFN